MDTPLTKAAGPSLNSRISAFLANPLVDKTFAVLACLPFLYIIYLRLRAGTLDIVRINICIQNLIVIVTMLARRTPVRVTINPWFWLLAFIATYWLFLTATVTAPGTAIAPRWFSVGLSWFGLAITVYARLSLGRNIGLVPAQRQLVTTGAYGLVRHPIYTSMFITYLSIALLSYSPGNIVIIGLGVIWFVIKSFIEEGYLAADPEYAEYMRRVRWRWLPGII
ncbi:MAG: hypothetical protein JL50_13820 [Peptococcaceae bacterium BICA1-7]|nr:MAG: hypothetical protein JL50_13820 [Peptococcaceae bacterium BICA1-7]HBV96484.1 isoprenylcysteine carboxylmethyltransferase family protein [Desulfotomaculum sp.]